MKVVGIMCVKDEADLLPEVLEHLDGKLDALYAYEDGSMDSTYKILKSYPGVTYLMRKQDDKERLSIKRPHYHHLLEKIKEDFKGEDVWCVITMGDRFFLNKSPRKIVEDAEAGGYTTVNAVQLDFLRHREAGWTEENDTFPMYEESLRNTCRWFKFDEWCIIAFRLSDARSYKSAKYPWPKGDNDNVQYKAKDRDGKVTMDIPFLEHQGRRSPNAMLWRIESGSRKLSSKITLESYSFDGIVLAWKKFYAPYKLIPWVDIQSLHTFIEMYNEIDEERRSGKRDAYFLDVIASIVTNGTHRRTDLT